MESARKPGAVLVIILLFACGGSNEKAAEVASEERPPSNHHEPGATQQTPRKIMNATEATEALQQETETVSEQTRLSEKRQLNAVPRAKRTENVATSKPVSKSQFPQPETSEEPPAVHVEETTAEEIAPPPYQTEEARAHETGQSEKMEGSEDASPAQSVFIPPSPPRRLPTAANADARRIVVVNEAKHSGFETATLPSGSVIEVRTTERISSEDNVSGDPFGATLTQDLVADGKVVFRRGHEIRGRLLEVVRPGKVKGRGSVTFDLQELEGNDTAYALKTNSITIEAESSKGRDVATVGAATAIGAVLGAVFGGKKGAAVGGATAGGAGTAGVLLSRGRDVEIPAERLFSFRLEKDLEIRLQ